MREFLGKSVSQSSEPAKVHPYGEVGALDMTRADVKEIGVATDWGWDRFDNFGRAVPVRSSVVGLAIDLDELGEIHVGSEAFFHRSNIGPEAIRGNLESARDSLAEISYEFKGAESVALCNQVRDYKFRVCVQGNPGVSVSPLARVAIVQSSFFRMDKAPKLIHLNVLGLYFAHLGIKDTAALLTDCQQQRHDGVLVGSGKPRNSPDAHSFDHQGNDLCGLLDADKVVSDLGTLGAKGGATSGAAVPLNPMASVGSKLLNAGVLASLAGHGLLLDFSRGKPDNGVAVLVRASSALGFKPGFGSTRSRAVLPNYSFFGGDLGFIGTPLSVNIGSVSAEPFAFTANSRFLSSRLNLSFDHLVGSSRKASGSSQRLTDERSPFGISAVGSRKPSYSFPTVCRLSVSRSGYYLTGEKESFQNRVNRRQGIRVTIYTETAFRKCIFNFGCSEILSCALENVAYCIGKSRRFDDVVESLKITSQFVLVIDERQQTSCRRLMSVHLFFHFVTFDSSVSQFLNLEFNHFLLGVT
jgi:hypothetical protein